MVDSCRSRNIDVKMVDSCRSRESGLMWDCNGRDKNDHGRDKNNDTDATAGIKPVALMQPPMRVTKLGRAEPLTKPGRDQRRGTSVSANMPAWNKRALRKRKREQR